MAGDEQEVLDAFLGQLRVGHEQHGLQQAFCRIESASSSTQRSSLRRFSGWTPMLASGTIAYSRWSNVPFGDTWSVATEPSWSTSVVAARSAVSDISCVG